MSVLRNLEEKLAGLVEGTFGRVFRTQVRPVEIARKLAREMDEHKTVSVSRTYVPNEYVVWLGPDDRERFEGVEHEVIDELGAYLLEHARRERLALISRPQIEFRTDDRLQLGEFGIQARLVRAAEQEGLEEPAEQAEHGQTMVYSTAGRLQEQLSDARAGHTRATVVAQGKRMTVGPHGAVLGRSRECDIVLDDGNVSRRHAEIRPDGAGGWRITDLGSTNGLQLNGRPVTSERLRSGDRVMVGTVDVRFEVE
jgi:predicted component of type VI protein secretion system